MMMQPRDEYATQILGRFRFRLARLREEAGLSQRELAALVNLDRSMIANLEGGHRQPRLAVLLALAHALSVTPGELLPLEPDAADQAALDRRRATPTWERRPETWSPQVWPPGIGRRCSYGHTGVCTCPKPQAVAA